MNWPVGQQYLCLDYCVEYVICPCIEFGLCDGNY